MALGDNYALLDDLKAYLDIPDMVDDTQIEDALASASREIETHTNRQFNDSGTASVRVYRPDSWNVVSVDDFSTTVGLVVKVDTGDTGVYDTTWLASDFQLEPLNGIVDGLPGWPYSRLRAVSRSSHRYFPTCSRRASVEVTARWGWAAVPDPVRQACLILASETFKLRTAPFGVAGFGEFGPVRVRANPKVIALLAPYRLNPVLVG